MTLKQHLDLLGHDAAHFAFLTKLPEGVIQRALSGSPVAAPHAERIAQKLSLEHSLHHQEAIQVSDIEGLNVVTPAALKRTSSNSN